MKSILIAPDTLSSMQFKIMMVNLVCIYKKIKDLENVPLTCSASVSVHSSSLKNIVQAGLPSQIKEVSLEIQSYWNFCEEITIEIGFYSKGQESLFPQAKGRLC